MKLRARTKRRISGCIAFAALILAIGFVGGMEHFICPISTGLPAVVVCLLIFTVGGCKAGWFRS
ncbi:MAG: hypothetical protein IKZ82_06250 [Clostridia bacterium]|nr:hypothetical protein [Clostridia bacterium]